MPRVKVARKSTAIDMTAMCDVAFLLLTFFILTAKPKVEDPSKAEVPASIKEVTIPDDNVLTVSVGQQDKIFLAFSGTDVRSETLKTMGEKYKVDFTPAEINRFANTEVFGVPMSQLKQFLSTPTGDLKSFDQRGIPKDTTVSNELSDWIITARKANRGLHQQDYHIAIKGDRKEQYPAINTVIAIFGHQRLFKFDLITSLKATPKK